jgi:8-oxo-dGTP pyrophosphatase MutT (NUDIX family)
MNEVLKEFQTLPRFTDGRINYSNSKRAPVITCFIKYKDKILLLKRSNKVGSYKEKWGAVSGYIDEDRDLTQTAFNEVEEELGIKKENVLTLKQGERYELFDPAIGRTWIICPFLLELKDAPELILDWEHTEFKWINPEEINDYDIDIGLDETLKKVL